MAQVAFGLPRARHVGHQVDDAAILCPLLADLEDASIGEAKLVAAARLVVARDGVVDPGVAGERPQDDDAPIDHGRQEVAIGDPWNQEIGQLRQHLPKGFIAEGEPLVRSPDDEAGADMGNGIA